MLEREQRAFIVQHADVVGRAHLVDFGNQGFRPDHVAEANAGQTELAQGAHQQHMAVLCHAVCVALAGKRLVGFVHHDQTTLRADGFYDLFNHRVVPQVGRGVVWIRQIGNRRLVLSNGGQHGGFVEFEVGRQINADELQALQLRAHGVHHETWQRREDGAARHIASQRQQRNQLVRAVAQHDVEALGHLCIVS